ncbi:MAG: hypothetical protein MAGBODY4_01444 [Candidatus Marinimicrobia bacterium]|nr:hypothetical protein [Candidatus Neomarinimicrobiota bacterium]
MKQLLTMLHREWMEWRKVVYIILGVFVGLTVLSTYWTYRAANKLEKKSFIIRSDGDTLSVESSIGWGGFEWNSSGEEHPDSLDLREKMRSKPGEFFNFLAWLLRGLMIGINLLVLSVSVFYLADALYKERADGSTFYYRSLPVTDFALLGAKFIFGYLGILVLSYLLSSVVALYLPLSMPGIFKEMLSEASLSLSQIRWGALFLDWGMFHIIQFIWLLPFAMYFLYISASVKGRPLLIGAGILILAVIAWQLIFGKIGFQNQIAVHLGFFSNIISEQWYNIPETLSSNAKIDLFGSFTGYLITLRTFVSLLIGGAFGWGTYYMYQRNIEVT